MVDGFVKCAAAGIKVQVADTVFNAKQIMDKTKELLEITFDIDFHDEVEFIITKKYKNKINKSLRIISIAK
jgi:hypothetical protein